MPGTCECPPFSAVLAPSKKKVFSTPIQKKDGSLWLPGMYMHGDIVLLYPLIVSDTVGGQNPAPPRMMNIPLILGF